MGIIKLDAFGKINLGLDVIRKRPNGYHEVKMLMQTVNICDSLIIESTPGNGNITINTNFSYLPTGENNLVCKAARLLMEEFHITDNLLIDLIKRLPVSAGMAGGSADAAATLIGVNELFHLGLNANDLMKRGLTLGADIPYCILGGTALSEGIGEILTPLPAPPACSLLIVKPPIHISTKYVYENLNLTVLKHHPDIDGIVDRIKGGDLLGIAKRLENVLESVTIPIYPIIAELKEDMINHHAACSLMSGSGPTVFGFYEDKEKAAYTERLLLKKRPDHKIFLTEFHNKKGVIING